MMRHGFLLGLLLLVCGLTTGWSQHRGRVTVTATPETVCAGEPSNLHAEANTDMFIDFETGDFSQYTFVNNGPYPWTVVSADNGSSYCMKSGNAGVVNSTSAITATVTYAQDGYVSFLLFSRGEGSNDNDYDWDNSRFYIDGVMQFRYGMHSAWETYVGMVSAGTHTFKWEYKKDGSINPSGDAFFVDDIVFSYTPIGSQQTYNFENGTFQGWKNIDADGDGTKWKMGSSSSSYYTLSVPGHNNSSHCVYSESFVCTSITYDEYNYMYTFQGSSATPDNYLVSPSKMTVHNGAYISFWACGVAQWPSEHFGVAVSTVNNPTSGSHFTTIKEWTMTSKGDDDEWSRGGWPSQGDWHQYTADLSAYAGQSIWVAIRHFNCTFEFYLGVDDIVLYEGSSGSSTDDITYHWSNGMTGPDITVHPNATTTYTVTASQTDGTVIGTAQQTVAVYADPNLAITTKEDEAVICLDDSITLYATMDIPAGVMVGDILCTDGTTVKPSDYASSGKTAKGVVFYVDATGQHGWAVNKEQSTSKQKWSTEAVFVPGLQTYAHWMDAVADFNGYGNTQQIRNKGDASKYPAAWSVNFNDDWYLPAIGQLNILFGAIDRVNKSLALVGGTQISYTSQTEIWSSSISANNEYALMLAPQSGKVTFDKKSNSHFVRAVINF